MREVVVIEGDGIGPEVVAAALEILERADVRLDWRFVVAGSKCFETSGEPIASRTLNEIRSRGAALKGPFHVPSGGGYKSPNYYIRRELDLYACVRPFETLEGRFHGVLIRENTEDHYAAVEWVAVPGVAHALKVITERASRRISEFAFSYARNENIDRVTAIHKANNLKMTDGLFLRCASEVAERLPSVSFDDMLVDTAAGLLAAGTESFGVLLTTNTYGDILSSVGAAKTSSLGCGASANVGRDTIVCEASHGSAPQLEGSGKANPLGMIRAAVMLLRHFGLTEPAQRIQAAVTSAALAGAVTPDLGGDATTGEVIAEIVRRLTSRPIEVGGDLAARERGKAC